MAHSVPVGHTVSVSVRISWVSRSIVTVMLMPSHVDHADRLPPFLKTLLSTFHNCAFGYQTVQLVAHFRYLADLLVQPPIEIGKQSQIDNQTREAHDDSNHEVQSFHLSPIEDHVDCRVDVLAVHSPVPVGVAAASSHERSALNIFHFAPVAVVNLQHHRRNVTRVHLAVAVAVARANRHYVRANGSHDQPEQDKSQ